MQPQFLYRYYRQDGRCLYVGITNNLARRARQHAKDSKWWRDVDHSQTEEVELGPVPRWRARRIERKEIKRLKPLGNTQHNNGLGRFYRPVDRSWAEPLPFDGVAEVLAVFSPVVVPAAFGVVVAGCSALHALF